MEGSGLIVEETWIEPQVRRVEQRDHADVKGSRDSEEDEGDETST